MSLVLVLLACVGSEAGLSPLERLGPVDTDETTPDPPDTLGDAPEDTTRKDPAALWESETLPVFSLTFEEEDWEGALTDLVVYGNCDEREYLRGDLVFTNPLSGREERWEGVGVRYRGRSSLTTPNHTSGVRWGFKLSFEAFVDDRRFHGSERVSLLGTEGDPTLLRERVALDWMRAAGVPAARANHAILEVNGELLGVFPLVEEADDRAFLDAHFGDDQGSLYKVAGYCHGTDLDYQGSDVDRYDGFEAKGVTTDEDKATDLVPMLACLEAGDSHDALRSCLDDWIDVEEWITEIAMDMLLTNVDGMSATGQNFLLYRPPSGRFVVYPYDLDLTFYNPYATNVVSPGIFDLRPSWEPRLPVLPRQIREAYATEFCDRVIELATEPGPEALEAHIEALAAQIDAAIDDDPFLDHSRWRDRVDDLIERMHDRHDYVVDEARACDIPPEIVEPPAEEPPPEDTASEPAP